MNNDAPQPPTFVPTGPSRESAVWVVGKLREAGHTAYLAGGCVRDRLLGVPAKDHDVATDATPDAVQALFKRTQAVGAAFGVVLVRTPIRDAEPIEVATFRLDGAYSDGRRPDTVVFTTAEEDAKRRDFTINAMFEDPLTNPPTVIDFVDGQTDLQQRVIRAVGDPSERFAEDHLRMLRAVRFAARLGFNLDTKTAAAIRSLAKHLSLIARERIGQETMAMLQHPNAPAAAEQLQQLGLDGPTLKTDHCELPLPTLHALVQQQNTAAAPAPGTLLPTRLLAWQLDRLSATATTKQIVQHQQALHANTKRWRKALCLTNQTCQDLTQLIRLLTAADAWPHWPKAKRKRWLAEPLWQDALALLHTQPDDRICQAIANEHPALLAEGVCPAPWLDGADLIQAGLKPSPRFGQLLDEAYDEQLENRLPDKNAALAWLQAQLA